MYNEGNVQGANTEVGAGKAISVGWYIKDQKEPAEEWWESGMFSPWI